MLLCGEWMTPSGQFKHCHVGSGTKCTKNYDGTSMFGHVIIVLTWNFFLFLYYVHCKYHVIWIWYSVPKYTLIIHWHH